ncbi:MAG: hypothetical protein HW421_1744 [Ignavibacteria bacterium]|nr:hypothetical protein [Ignavibacteria bacterium]
MTGRKMKTKILFLLFISVISFEIADCKPYRYPMRPGNSKWKEQKTYVGKVKLCNIPDSILNRMPSLDLIESVFEFPFIQNLILYDDCIDGINRMKDIFNGLDDMLKRNDLPFLLYQYYLQDSTKLNYTREIILEIILSHPDILIKLDKAVKNEMLGNCLDKLNNRTTKKCFLSMKSMTTSTFLMIRLISHLDNNYYRNIIDSDVEIKSFSENCGIPTEATTTKIIYEAIRFRNR